MKYQIELVAPIAVCYTPKNLPSRAIFCELQKTVPKKLLSDFFLGQTNNPPRQPFVWLHSDDKPHWEQHSQYPELTFGPRRYANDDDLIYCQFEQENQLIEKKHTEARILPPQFGFFFSTTAQPNDVWRVWASNEESPILGISSWGSNAFGSVIDPSQPDGGLVVQKNGWLQPTPNEPFLPFYATDTDALNRWNNDPLPFRVRLEQEDTP